MSDGLAIVLRGVSFAYPEGNPVLSGLSWQLPAGSFALVTGAVGSGKSTLLRLLKPGLSPVGELAGELRVSGVPLREMGRQESAERIGFVAQDPEAHIVCDTVERELAFGLENVGMEPEEMRCRVAGVAHFLGIAPLVRRRTAELSGGELQAVAIGSALALMPRLLLLDEPTSRLDPVAARNFYHLLFRANRELGITVVVCTHAPEEATDYATCCFELAGGRLHQFGGSVGDGARATHASAGEGSDCIESPVVGTVFAEGASIGEQKRRLECCAQLASSRKVPPTGASMHAGSAIRPAQSGATRDSQVVTLDDVHYRYGRGAAEAVWGVDLALGEGEVVALVGANGSGKSTLLRLVAGMLRPQRGRVTNHAAKRQAFLPQNPKALFVRDSASDELGVWRRGAGYGEAEIADVIRRMGLEAQLASHPYDLSGGQQQLLALAKLLLTQPRLLILDEPTQGVDPASRVTIARELRRLADAGATVLLATHDLAFASRVANRVALVFDGSVACDQPTGEFFADNLFYQVREDGFTRLLDSAEDGGELGG